VDKNDWFYWQLEKEKRFPFGEDFEELTRKNEEEKLDEKKLFLPAFVKDDEK
jgi:hypothetical protein